MSRSRVGWVVMAAVLGVAGCGGPEPTAKPSGPAFKGVTIGVAAIGDPGVLPTVNAQRGEWEASRGATCVIGTSPVNLASAGAEVLVFRADRLGDLVDADALAVLPESLVRPPAPAAKEPGDAPAIAKTEEPEGLDFADVIPAFREQVSKYGNDRMALPYGGSALVLAYRPAAFEREANRTAAKADGLTLQPPETWEQLDALARFFQGRDWDGDGSKDNGIALALGDDPEGVGDALFLARAASLGQHRDHYSLLFDSDNMTPRVASPPFVEALEKVVALKASGPPGVEGFSATAAREAFRMGHVALLIDRAERATTWSESAPVNVAVLPGSTRVYEPSRKAWEESAMPNRPSYLPYGGGWLVGVSSKADGPQKEAAIDFVKYLISPDTSSRVRADLTFPMLAVRGGQVGQGLPDPSAAPGVESRLWADAVGRTLGAVRVVPGLRIPQAEGYLADLAKGRVAAVKGEPASKALQGVADNWSKRTESLGVPRQLWHYRRSLNKIVTMSNPPAR